MKNKSHICVKVFRGFRSSRFRNYAISLQSTNASNMFGITQKIVLISLTNYLVISVFL